MKPEAPNRYALAAYAADMLATALSLFAAEWLRRTLVLGRPFDARGGGLNVLIYAMALAIWTVTFRQLSAYDTDRVFRVADEVQTVLGAVATSTLVLAGILYFTFRGLSRLLFIYFFVLDVVAIILFRLAVRLLLGVLRPTRTRERHILVVGAGDIGRQIAALLDKRRWLGLHVVGFVDDEAPDQNVGGFPVLGTLAQTPQLVEEYGIHEVIVALPLDAETRLVQLVSALNEMPVNVRVVPGFFPLAYLRTSVGMLGDVPLVTLKEPVLNGSALLAKRVLDVVVASVSLALLWPFMLLIAVLIKLDSRGPALFKQQRLGWQSRPFHMLKFRTMVEGADKDIGLILAETEEGKRYLRKDEADPRITRFGRHLRRWSLDELPQLWNVLKGEMSLVGPRPDLPLLAQDYEPWQRMRFSVPPGMTGWWQVTGRSDRPSTLYTEEDLYYIRNYSLLLDLWILLRTVGAVIRRKGAY